MIRASMVVLGVLGALITLEWLPTFIRNKIKLWRANRGL